MSAREKAESQGVRFKILSREDAFVVEASKDGFEIASLEAERALTKPAFRVTGIAIARGGPYRSGLGTALYEVALEHACSEGIRIHSDFYRSHFAEAFWRKQFKKGRARCVKRNRPEIRRYNVFYAPLESARGLIEEACVRRYPGNARAQRTCVREGHAPFKSLPRPTKGAWPCHVWGFRKDLCKGPMALDGLRGRLLKKR